MKISVCLLVIACCALSTQALTRGSRASLGGGSPSTNRRPSIAPRQAKHNIRSVKSNQGNDADKHAQTLRNDQEMHSDGSYHYQYETGNGIKAQEQGTGGVAVQGSSSYISPEGVEIKMSYTADETGYHPVGDHIPKIPDYILRSLEYIRTHPFKVVAPPGLATKTTRGTHPISTEIAPPPVQSRNALASGNYKRVDTTFSRRNNARGKSQYQNRNAARRFRF